MKQPLEIVTELGLSAVNPGASTGAGWWSSVSAVDRLESVNPSTGEVIARVTPATAADYERVVGDVQRSFAQWRLVPAPKRGEVIRLIG
ncbi:MAG: aldehyde dehydrogenase family protein, partial [Nitrospirales bacterium]